MDQSLVGLFLPSLLMQNQSLEKLSSQSGLRLPQTIARTDVSNCGKVLWVAQTAVAEGMQTRGLRFGSRLRRYLSLSAAVPSSIRRLQVPNSRRLRAADSLTVCAEKIPTPSSFD